MNTESNFERLEERHIGALDLDFSAYVHTPTGARHYHFAAADRNNAFMVAFPTLPQDSTGVAHILEHTTLCGSRRFPVRDPFFMMLRRSLNSFMNAFTSSDCTAYPFATQNEKDFDNLLQVYLDAVFFPLLDPLDFAQEGWRVEFADGDDPRAELTYKGVVFNEMKGAMSSPVAQLWQHLHAGLFPSTIYRFNSGGDPDDIPDLDYAGLRAFHHTYYHPSNAVFMTYGTFPAAEHQRRFEQYVLESFSGRDERIISELQPSLAAPAKAEAAYAVTSKAQCRRATHVVWGWLLGESADPDALLDAHLLSGILLDNSGSPLRRYLETTPLATAPSELCGIDDSARQLVFCCGVEGAEAAAAEQLETEMLTVIDDVIATGVAADTLSGLIDRIEMSQRDIGGDGYPFGLQLMSRALPGAVYLGDPAELLDLDQTIARLRARTNETDYVRSLLQGRLVDNPHRVRVVMIPDPEKTKRDQRRERQRLRETLAGFEEGTRAAVVEQAAALAARQEEPQDTSILPKVTLTDVAAELEVPAAVAAGRGRLRGTSFHQGTNGIVHCHQVYELPALSAEEQKYLPLFCEYLTELGTAAEDYTDTQTRRAKIGEFGAYASARASIDDAGRLSARFVVSAKGLKRNSRVLVDALAEIVPLVRFDEAGRLRDLVAQTRADEEASITDQGHHLAVAGAARGLSPAAFLDDLWSGPTGINIVQTLDDRAQDPQRTAPELGAAFEAIREKLTRSSCQALCIGEADVASGVMDSMLDKLSAAATSIDDSRYQPPVPTESAGVAWITNTQVNFCAKAYRCPPQASKDAAELMVLGRYLQDGFLHAEIREKGGAYGSGAGYDADSATFRFFSYRDPCLSDTLETFDRCLDWLTANRDPERLEESILGVIRAIDKPRSPAGAASYAFYSEMDGRNVEFRRRERQRVLAVTQGGIIAAAERYLRPATGTVGVVTHAGAGDVVAGLGLEQRRL
jgi:Zn-dependent M16 (insulinase) family peptidase